MGIREYENNTVVSLATIRVMRVQLMVLSHRKQWTRQTRNLVPIIKHSTEVATMRIRSCIQTTFTLFCLLQQCAALESSSPPAPSDGESLRRVWVRYEKGAHDSCARTIQNHGAKGIKYDFPDTDSIVLTATESEIEALQADPAVLSVEDDPKRYLQHRYLRQLSTTTPWHGQLKGYGVTLVEADQMWREGLTGKGILICVVDTGVAVPHPDINATNFSGDSLANWEPWNFDFDGHGTLVSGAIAASDNDLGIVGIAPDAKIHVVKVFDSSGAFVYASALVDAAYRCRDAGAQIISMSLGGPDFSTAEAVVLSTLFTRDGILSVASAGNDGNGCNGGDIAYSYPASYENVLSVGAVDSNMAVAVFSQHNDAVDLVAPGVNIWSTLPQNFNCASCNTPYLGYGVASGTSFSAPICAGAAALLWSHDPSTNVEEIRRALIDSAKDLGPVGRDNCYGNGLVAARHALGIVQPSLASGRGQSHYSAAVFALNIFVALALCYW